MATTASKQQSAERQEGTIKFFSQQRSFGFIKPDDGTRDVFLSGDRLAKGMTVKDGQRCAYTTAMGKKGPFVTELWLL